MRFAYYLSYYEYQKMGGTLSQAEFAPLEFKCRKRIDNLTQSRVQHMRDVPEAVIQCMFALIPIEAKLGLEAQTSNPVATSFNTDGYSETYGNSLSVSEAAKSMNSLITLYLDGETDDRGIPLLYRGVYIDDGPMHRHNHGI